MSLLDRSPVVSAQWHAPMLVKQFVEGVGVGLQE